MVGASWSRRTLANTTGWLLSQPMDGRPHLISRARPYAGRGLISTLPAGIREAFFGRPGCEADRRSAPTTVIVSTENRRRAADPADRRPDWGFCVTLMRCLEKKQGHKTPWLASRKLRHHSMAMVALYRFSAFRLPTGQADDEGRRIKPWPHSSRNGAGSGVDVLERCARSAAVSRWLSQLTFF